MQKAARTSPSKGELRSQSEPRRSPLGGLSASGANEASPKAMRKTQQTKNKSELARRLIVSPHVSEKSVILGDGNYVFKVAPGANKSLVKNAIEDRYGVKVESVNILAPRDKKRRRGANIGIKSGFKKAVVKLQEGQTISEF